MKNINNKNGYHNLFIILKHHPMWVMRKEKYYASIICSGVFAHRVQHQIPDSDDTTGNRKRIICIYG